MRIRTTVVALGALTLLGAGCKSVRMVQREGCWVRQTERWMIGATREEMGPCQRPAQAWAEDPATRVVQECVAQADYRWQARALDAWSHGAPMPAREGEDDGVLQGCLGAPLRKVLGENEALRARLEAALRETEALRAQTSTDHGFLQSSHDRLTDALGEAAIKPPGAAVATATSSSEGTARTEGALSATASQERESPAATGTKPRVPGPRAAPGRLELMKHAPADDSGKGGDPGETSPRSAGAPSGERASPGVPADAASPGRALEVTNALPGETPIAGREAPEVGAGTDSLDGHGGSGCPPSVR